MFRDTELAKEVLKPECLEAFEPLLDRLADLRSWSLAGSIRRRLAIANDLDLVVLVDSPSHDAVLEFVEKLNQDKTAETVHSLYGADNTLAQDGCGSFHIKVSPGAKADIQVVGRRDLGAALLWLTGPLELGRALDRYAEFLGVTFTPQGILKPVGSSVSTWSEQYAYRFLTNGMEEVNGLPDLPRELPPPILRTPELLGLPPKVLP